jgi:hypothetical protein
LEYGVRVDRFPRLDIPYAKAGSRHDSILKNDGHREPRYCILLNLACTNFLDFPHRLIYLLRSYLGLPSLRPRRQMEEQQ